jgi:hypothetical protein
VNNDSQPLWLKFFDNESIHCPGEEKPMRIVIILALALSVTGCVRWAMNSHLNNAYRAYDAGDCATVTVELSQVDRDSRARPYVWPEVSMLRGQCLERQNLFIDAAQTYEFIIAQYPQSEYAYRANARLVTLEQLGHYHPRNTAQVRTTAY